MAPLNPDLRLDNRDIAILAILSREGRIAKTELAARVNLSPTPCWERMKRLEAAGLIRAGLSSVLADRLACGPDSCLDAAVELTADGPAPPIGVNQNIQVKRAGFRQPPAFHPDGHADNLSCLFSQ